jgi:hypothetical protein
MHHVGTVVASSKFPPHTVYAQCSCGTAGHFKTAGEATGYLQGHFAKLGGVSTFELVDKSAEPEAPATEEPKPDFPVATEMPAPETAEQLEHDGPAKAVTPEFPEAK